MRRRLIAIISILTMLFLLTGCNNAKATEEKDKAKTKMGRYVEQKMQTPDLSPNEITLGVIGNASDQLEYYTYEYDESNACKVNCYQLTNNTYEKKQVLWAAKAAKTLACDPVQILLGQDNKYYMLGQNLEVLNSGTGQEAYKNEYYLIQGNTDSEEYLDVTPDAWRYNPKEDKSDEEKTVKGVTINAIQISKNGLLCYQSDYKDNLYFYDLNKKKDADSGNLQTEQKYTVKENKLYYIPVGGLSINCYDLESEKEDKYQSQKIKSTASIQVSPNGDIYLADNDGVHCYSNGGTMWETIVDGSICTMCSPSYEITSFIVIPGEFNTFYVMYTSLIDNNTLLEKYIYDTTVAATFDKELTVYSLWDNISLREAIFDYMKKHPDTKVKYMVAITEDSAATVNDQIRELNTEILSGKGADVLLLDGLPMESYIQKGVLIDIADIFSGQMEEGSLVKNISDNYMKDGKVYGMPIRFFVPMYAFNKGVNKDATSISSLAQLSLQSDRKLLNSLPYNVLLTMFLYTYPDEVIGSDGLIDPTALTSFLTNIKTIADQTDAVSEEESDYGMRISYSIGNNQRIQKILCGNASELVVCNVDASMGYVSDMQDIQLCEACLNEIKGDYQTVNYTFIPNGIAGINKSAKDIDLARDFVKSLYSEEIQDKHLNDGFPMNSKVLNKWMTEKPNPDSYFTLGICDDSGKTHMIHGHGLEAEEKKKINDMILSLTKPVNNDTTVQDMIVEGGLAYLRGEKTIEQAVQEITDKVNLYLNE